MWLRLRALALSGIILAALLGLPALGGLLLGGPLAAAALTLAMVAAGVLAARYADRYVLRALHARRLQPWQAPELFRLVHLLAARAELVPPRVYLIEADHPNAITVGHSAQSASIAVTRGLLRRLDLRELAGVLAHELAHIRHRDILVASIASSVTAAWLASARLLLWPALVATPLLLAFAPKLLLAFVLVFVSPVLTVLLQAALSRQREFAADAEAARLTGDPLGLAAALDRLRPRRHPLLVLLFGAGPSEAPPSLLDSHPPTPERIARLLELRLGMGSR